MILFSLHFSLSFCSNLSQALAGALTLGYSNKVLTIFMAVLDEEIDMKKEQIDIEKYSSTSKLFQVELGTKLDKLVGSWNDAEIERMDIKRSVRTTRIMLQMKNSCEILNFI